nr:unnamed protein product [Callosobruchus analis]
MLKKQSSTRDYQELE